jgi:hypothetical protein
VSARPTTKSVVLEHDGPLDELLAWLRARELLDVGPARPRQNGIHPLGAIADALEGATTRVRGSPESDLRVVTFYGLLGLSALQLVRGHVLPPAETLLQHALKLLPRKPPSSRS